MGKPQAKVLFDYRRGMLPGVSGALVPEGAANTAKNVRFRGGIIERGEYSVYTTNLSLSSTDTPTAIFYHSDYKSDVHGILTTREKIFRKKNDAAWTQIGTWPTAFHNADFPIVDGVGVTYVDGVTTKNSFILTDGMNVLQEINLDAGTVAPLGGSPPICHTITEFQSHLLLGYTNVGATPESPYRLQWSDTGKYNVWTGGNSGFIDLADEFGPVVGYERMGDRLYVYKLNCIYEVLYIGPPRMFDAHQVVSGRGAASSRAIAHMGTSHCFIGSNGQIYEFNGRELKILSEQLELSIPKPRAQIMYNDALQEVWLLGLYSDNISSEGIFEDPGLHTYIGSSLLRLHLPTNSWWASETGGTVTCIASPSMIKSIYSTSSPALSWLTPNDAEGHVMAGIGEFPTANPSSTLVRGVAEIGYGGYNSASSSWSAHYAFGNLALGMSTRVVEVLVELESSTVSSSQSSGDLTLYLVEGTVYTNCGSPTKIYADGSVSHVLRWKWVSWTMNTTKTNVAPVIVWSPGGISSSIRRVVVRFIPRTRPFLAPVASE